MSTVKYKATDRYDFNWSDPRKIGKTGFEDVPTDVLRNLWLVKFGERVVNTNDVPTDQAEDIVNVGRELAFRNQIRHEKQYRADLDEVRYYYILEKEDGNN
jgi:hypothetical protein